MSNYTKPDFSRLLAAMAREKQLSFDGGYIAASSHSIVDAIPPENYRAMIDTAVDYGRY